MSKLLSLPDEILKLVLQHVPLRDRLGVMQNCSKLTRLDLECNFSDTQKATPVLDCLSSLVDLQHLVLSPTQRDSTALAGSTLPPFPELTTLTASCMDVGFFDNLAHSSSLLQLSVLPSPGEVTVGPREMPLDLPASLTKLSLHCQIEVGLLSLVPETLRELNIDGGVKGHAEPFLSGIARLQHLSALLLESLDGLAWSWSCIQRTHSEQQLGVAYLTRTQPGRRCGAVYLSCRAQATPPYFRMHRR